MSAFELLVAPGGERLLAVAMSSYGVIEPLALNERLRTLDGGHPADLVAAAMTQAALRRAAKAKFGADDTRLYFTPPGLEQATHPVVADHRAARAREILGTNADADVCFLDLGCGVGSDLVAFARTGFDVVGVDLDGVTVAVARANLAALGLPGSVRAGRAEDVDRRG